MKSVDYSEAAVTGFIIGCVGGAIICLALALMGCSAPTEARAAVPQTETVGMCAQFSGARALQNVVCPDGTTMLDARCDVTGGALETNHQGWGPNVWECGVVWDDSRVGGTLCAHAECSK